MNPFKHRPDNLNDEDWEDNWLSNAMAWASMVVTPGWCKTPEHWSSRVTNYIWTDCACCLAWRGLIIGAAVGFVAGALVS